MSKRNAILIAAMGGVALWGCSAFETRHAGLDVVPYQSVRHGSDGDMLYQAGRIFQSRGRYADAILAYRQVLMGTPTHVEAHNGLAVSYALAGKPELAEAEFRAALALAPDSAHLHNNLGYFLAQSGRAQEAVAELDRARELDPASPVIATNLASADALAGPREPVAVSEPVPAPQPEAAPAASPRTITPQAAETAILQPSVAPAAVAPTVTPPAVVASAPNAAPEAPAAALAPPPVAPAPVASLAVAYAPVASPSIASAPAASTPIAPSSTAPASSAALLPGYRVEVSNGNGTRLLAWRTSRLLQPLGIAPARLTNSKPFGVQASRLQYVAGAEAQAHAVNALLPAQIPLAQVSSLERNAKVRVLLGRDFPATATRVADVGRKPGA